MERPDRLQKIAIALQNCMSAKEIKITDYFTVEEIYDFANTVVAYLPESYEYRFTEIDRNILNIFADKKYDILNSNIHSLARNISMSNVKYDEQEQKYLNHIIFMALMSLKLKYNQNVDNTLDDITNYYKSVLLPADKLKQNIEEINNPAALSYFDNKGNYVRLDDFTNTFVPTLTTKQNFKFLIIN